MYGNPCLVRFDLRIKPGLPKAKAGGDRIESRREDDSEGRCYQRPVKIMQTNAVEPRAVLKKNHERSLGRYTVIDRVHE